MFISLIRVICTIPDLFDEQICIIGYVAGWSHTICVIYDSTCFLGWICKIQILHGISSRQVKSLIRVICVILDVYDVQICII